MLERKRKRGDPAVDEGEAPGTSGEGRPAKQQAAGGKQQQQQQGKGKGQQEAGGGGGAVGGDDGGVKVLRTYGQRKAKADPVTDAAAPRLSSGLLRLIAGKQGG